MQTTDDTINTINPRQETLNRLAADLMEYDFKTFDPRTGTDKQVLMNYLKYINSQLGKLLKGYE